MAAKQVGGRTRALASLLFALAVGLLLNNGLLTALVRANAYDFSAFYLAGRGILERADFYRDDTMASIASRAPGTAVTRFVYPPASAAMFLPLGLLPFWLACRVWLMINLGCLALVAYLLAPYLLGTLGGEERLLWAGFGALLFAGYHSLGHILQVGQATLVVAAFLLGGLELARVKRDLASGVVLAIGTFFKPVSVLLIVYLLAKRRWRVAAFWLAAMAVGAAASIALLGSDIHVSYLRCFTRYPGAPEYWVSYQDATAFWGRLFKWQGHSPLPQYGYLAGPLTIATQVVLFLPLVPLLLLRRWEQLTDRRMFAEVSLLLLAVILGSNLSAIHVFLLAAFGLAVGLAYLREFRQDTLPPWYLTIAWTASYCLLALPFQYRAPELRHGILMLAISTKFYGGLILWGLLTYLLAWDTAAPEGSIQQTTAGGES